MSKSKMPEEYHIPDFKQVKACIAWYDKCRFNKSLLIKKNAFDTISSYYWKHVVEKDVGFYIKEASFKFAMDFINLDYKNCEHSESRYYRFYPSAKVHFET